VELAQRLRHSLLDEGFDVWLDSRPMKAGTTWTTGIERAEDEGIHGTGSDKMRQQSGV